MTGYLSYKQWHTKMLYQLIIESLDKKANFQANFHKSVHFQRSIFIIFKLTKNLKVFYIKRHFYEVKIRIVFLYKNLMCWKRCSFYLKYMYYEKMNLYFVSNLFITCNCTEIKIIRLLCWNFWQTYKLRLLYKTNL